jgi:hypothetical protein
VLLRTFAVLALFSSTGLHAGAELSQAIQSHPDLGLLSVIGLGILGGGVFSAMRTRRDRR